ncbi:MAG: hypothetical protein QOE61_4664 [Micromonosporaceae bacterium]|nr:hypothetical protein [Micromonosporaceae bacterium]
MAAAKAVPAAVQPYTDSEAPFIPGQPSSGPKAVNGLVRIDVILSVEVDSVQVGQTVLTPLPAAGLYDEVDNSRRTSLAEVG